MSWFWPASFQGYHIHMPHNKYCCWYMSILWSMTGNLKCCFVLFTITPGLILWNNPFSVTPRFPSRVVERRYLKSTVRLPFSQPMWHGLCPVGLTCSWRLQIHDSPGPNWATWEIAPRCQFGRADIPASLNGKDHFQVAVAFKYTTIHKDYAYIQW